MTTAYERTKAWRAANPERQKELRVAAYARNRDKERDQQRAYDRSPKGRYAAHKKNAKRRGVDFLITYEEWRDVWLGHWENRGQGKSVMCRTGDTGAYELGNVRIDTQSNNAKEQHLGEQP